ncbi:putative integral membrane protein [Halovivax ruber XH-70]|uniref:Putative integral membrane protein n=1 Tax=Halovivax ruber (strain DSM 18193 / JCM 13892 / XH-70) TaxID=797302 RepID=L0IEI1_HALRX|nr:lysylphosphatidylglycerol synthase transmembrane domain-containing protein [Halovivax ruber]AGB17243.1 putative integral membrane protein [Halovivax ruber XH-70]
MDDGPPESNGETARSDAEWSLSTAARRYGPLFGTLLVGIGLVLAARNVDGGELLATISLADPAILATAGALYAASWPLRGRRYGDVLSPMGHRAGTTVLTAAVFVSQSANLVFPARAGDAVRAYVVNRKEDVPYSTGVASLAVERLFDLATITVLAGVAVGWLLLGGTVEPASTFAGTGGSQPVLLAAATVSTATVGACLVVITAAWTPAGRRISARLRTAAEHSARLAPVLAWVRKVGLDVGRVAGNPRSLLIVGSTSLLIWLVDVATAIMVLVALDSGLGGGSLLVVGTLAVSVGNLAKVLPLTQGGVGLYEAAFTALVVGLTPIGAGTALAAAVLDHALKNGITVVGGGAAAAVLGLSIGDVRATAAAPEDRHTF